MQAYQAQINRDWGSISALARQHNISRTFIYSLLATFKDNLTDLLKPHKETKNNARETSHHHILAQRFEGQCSLEAISTLLKRSGLGYSSVGYISQFLCDVGKHLPKTLSNAEEVVQFLAFANDEVFARSLPILITVDPISSAILRIELVDQRTADQWSKHLQKIVDHGFYPQCLVSDAGTGICAAHERLFDSVPWQLDTFHGLAYRLGDWVRKLENAVDAAMNKADQRANVLDSAKSDRVVEKRLRSAFEADQAIDKALDLYNDFTYLYHELIHQLDLFDHQGQLRSRDEAQGEMEAALELIASLDHETLCKAVASTQRALPDLLTYFADAKRAVNQCQAFTDDKEVLSTLFLAWQWDKAMIKAKQAERRQQAKEQQAFYLEWTQALIADDERYLDLKARVYAELDEVIRASSMVECINSILRPYLNTSKNQVTQEFLNTFMFYHNHRRYRAGKRKGKTPMELLIGKTQTEDWITLLLKEVDKSKSAYTLAA